MPKHLHHTRIRCILKLLPGNLLTPSPTSPLLSSADAAAAAASAAEAAATRPSKTPRSKKPAGSCSSASSSAGGVYGAFSGTISVAQSEARTLLDGGVASTSASGLDCEALQEQAGLPSKMGVVAVARRHRRRPAKLKEAAVLGMLHLLVWTQPPVLPPLPQLPPPHLPPPHLLPPPLLQLLPQPQL